MIETTEEAMAILKATRRRLLKRAREYAFTMLVSGDYPDGLTGGDVYCRMEERGEFIGLPKMSRHWVAAIFHGQDDFVPADGSQDNDGIGHVPLSRRWVLAR